VVQLRCAHHLQSCQSRRPSSGTRHTHGWGQRQYHRHGGGTPTIARRGHPRRGAAGGSPSRSSPHGRGHGVRACLPAPPPAGASWCGGRYGPRVETRGPSSGSGSARDDPDAGLGRLGWRGWFIVMVATSTYSSGARRPSSPSMAPERLIRRHHEWRSTSLDPLRRNLIVKAQPDHSTASTLNGYSDEFRTRRRHASMSGLRSLFDDRPAATEGIYGLLATNPRAWRSGSPLDTLDCSFGSSCRALTGH